MNKVINRMRQAANTFLSFHGRSQKVRLLNFIPFVVFLIRDTRLAAITLTIDVTMEAVYSAETLAL
jgi:hypothetical protein